MSYLDLVNAGDSENEISEWERLSTINTERKPRPSGQGGCQENKALERFCATVVSVLSNRSV